MSAIGSEVVIDKYDGAVGGEYMVPQWWRGEGYPIKLDAPTPKSEDGVKATVDFLDKVIEVERSNEQKYLEKISKRIGINFTPTKDWKPFIQSINFLYDSSLMKYKESYKRYFKALMKGRSDKFYDRSGILFMKRFNSIIEEKNDTYKEGLGKKYSDVLKDELGSDKVSYYYDKEQKQCMIKFEGISINQLENAMLNSLLSDVKTLGRKLDIELSSGMLTPEQRKSTRRQGRKKGIDSIEPKLEDESNNYMYGFIQYLIENGHLNEDRSFDFFGKNGLQKGMAYTIPFENFLNDAVDDDEREVAIKQVREGCRKIINEEKAAIRAAQRDLKKKAADKPKTFVIKSSEIHELIPSKEVRAIMCNGENNNNFFINIGFKGIKTDSYISNGVALDGLHEKLKNELSGLTSNGYSFDKEGNIFENAFINHINKLGSDEKREKFFLNYLGIDTSSKQFDENGMYFLQGGPDGGSLGGKGGFEGNINSVIGNLNSVFACAGFKTPENLKLYIANSAPGFRYENYYGQLIKCIAAAASVCMFSSGKILMRQIDDRINKLKNANPDIIHLFNFEEMNVPLSYMLQNLKNDLIFQKNLDAKPNIIISNNVALEESNLLRDANVKNEQTYNSIPSMLGEYINSTEVGIRFNFNFEKFMNNITS